MEIYWQKQNSGKYANGKNLGTGTGAFSKARLTGS